MANVPVRPFRARRMFRWTRSPGFHPGLSPFAPLGQGGVSAPPAEVAITSVIVPAIVARTAAADAPPLRRNAANGDSPGWSGAEPWGSPPMNTPPQRGGRRQPVNTHTTAHVPVRPFRARRMFRGRGPRGSTPGFHRLPRWGEGRRAFRSMRCGGCRGRHLRFRCRTVHRSGFLGGGKRVKRVGTVRCRVVHRSG
jgi:hypothetical protein